MKKLFRNIFIVLITIVLVMAFSSSYTSFSIDNLAFVIAIGIDTGDNDGNLKVSFQIAKPSSASQGSSTQDETSIINTVETSSIYTAINLMNSYIGKELNLSHCKLVVFSEEVATNGISNEIYTLINDVQIRPSTNIIVSKIHIIETVKLILQVINKPVIIKEIDIDKENHVRALFCNFL